MNGLSWLMAISGVLAIGNGAALLVLPMETLHSHGVLAASDATQSLGRMLGATLLGFGVINWMARSAPPSLTLWVIVLGGAVADSASLLVSLAAQWQGVTTGISGWLTVLLYFIFAGGFWYYLLRGQLK